MPNNKQGIGMNEEAKTPEEIAKEIRFDVPWITNPSGAQYDRPDWDAMEKLIAQAIRDAYERAAKLAEKEIDSEWPGDDLSKQAESIAHDIRTLKGEAR